MLIGADEVACEDVYHLLDWNADGVVNYREFEQFSHAWMTCDPNRPGGTSGYDATDLLRWNPQCDLDLDYDVDLDDLVIFADYQNGYWLWVACWLDSQMQQMMSMMPEGGVQTEFSSFSISDKTAVALPEKTIQQQVIELEDTVEFLEQLWLTDDSIQQEIDADVWKRFMTEVYDCVIEIETMETENSDTKGVKQ